MTWFKPGPEYFHKTMHIHCSSRKLASLGVTKIKEANHQQ